MKLKEIAKILISSLLLLSLANSCLAGFGVSPPWVRNYDLLPGSHFEQTVILSRGDPEEPLRAEVTFDLPEEIKDWISIAQGMEFILPEGGYQVPMTVIVDVPKDAKLGKYQGQIKVDTFPEKKEVGVSVGIAAGIEVDLEVTEKEVEGMKVRYTEILAEEDSPLMYVMRIENTGNVKTKPDRVYIEIWDYFEQNLLKTGETKDLDWIPPFQTEETTAEFPTIKLGIAAYWAKVKVFKGDQILREEKLVFEVFEKGTLPVAIGKKGNWFENLSSKFSFLHLNIGVGVILLIAAILLFLAERRRRRMISKVSKKRKSKSAPQEKKTIKIMDIKKKEE